MGTETGMWVVPSGQAVWLPPHHQHWFRSNGAFDGWTVYIAEELCRSLPGEPRVIHTSALLREAELRAALWRQGPRSMTEMRVSAVILDEIVSCHEEPFHLPLPSDSRLSRVCTAVIDNATDHRGLPAWAAVAGMSERTFSRRFVQGTGFSFSAWRQRARLVQSLGMLAEGHPVANIALDLGYATASGFIAVFRRATGETPVSYRRKLRGPS